ncbi:MAG: sensor histidine kinase [Pyrinomonadaceae bacterium]
MKRSWTTILLIAGLVCLLVGLGVLQYRWQTQITENQSERLHKSTQDEADRFASDFNREIQSSYFNFQTDAGAWKSKNWSEFNDRYDYWLSESKYPTLIKDFYYFDAGGVELPSRYSVGDRAFKPVEWNNDLRVIAARFSDPKNFQPVCADIYTLLLPMHEARDRTEKALFRRERDGSEPLAVIPRTQGYLAIVLDEKTVKEKLLSDLAASHFGDSDFNISIVGKDDQPVLSTQNDTRGGDANAGLFDVAPGDFIFYANKTLLPRKDPGKGSVVINSKIESRTFSRIQADGNSNRTMQIEVRSGDQPKTTVFAGRGDIGKTPWTLMVQHRDGSIDAFLANTKFRNLAIGFGILGLLGAAVAAIIFSAQRAKILAQRQIDFVSSVSHEFRTPLAVIYSAGENLADGVAKDAQVSRYGDLIKGEGRKLSAMVEQVLDFAGANSGRKKYNLNETPIAEIIDDALGECAPLIKEKNIQVETRIADLLPSINADRVTLSQAIQNLIANSVKYGHGEHWIRITAENGGDSVKISVEDRGIGISKSDARQIFEPFFRAKDVVDAQIHGNGLGLALVRQTVEAHGGKVTVESEYGKGSKFTIELKAIGKQ